MSESEEFAEEFDFDEFDIESFQNVVRSHWTYLSKGNISNWAIHKRADNVWQIGSAPVFQEVYGGTDDGKEVHRMIGLGALAELREALQL